MTSPEDGAVSEEMILDVDPALSGDMDSSLGAEIDPALSGDMFLKFTDEAEMLSVLFHDVAVEFDTVTDEETGEVTSTPTVFESQAKWPNTDVIGTIYEPTGMMLTDDEGNEYPEQAAIPGYHVNIRAEAPIEELAAYRVYPNNPRRVWL